MRFPFLPFYFRFAGYLSFGTGAIWAYFVLVQNYKPDFLNVNIFAIHSSYLDTRVMQMTRTNLADEIACLLMLVGLLMVISAKEKFEEDGNMILRYKSFVYAMMTNTFLLMLSVVFFFGLSFLEVLMITMISQPLLYIIFFEIFKYKKSYIR
ncbi:MAG: hypothetical protein WCO63_07370 [Bacteroidota bacterium]